MNGPRRGENSRSGGQGEPPYNQAAPCLPDSRGGADPTTSLVSGSRVLSRRRDPQRAQRNLWLPGCSWAPEAAQRGRMSLQARWARWGSSQGLPEAPGLASGYASCKLGSSCLPQLVALLCVLSLDSALLSTSPLYPPCIKGHLRQMGPKLSSNSCSHPSVWFFLLLSEP